MFLIENLKYRNILDIKKLEIKENIVTCILGESGSGKSTLLRLLNKLISIDSGTIKYNNKSIHDINSIDLRREVVMLSQTPTIFKGSIRDNLLIGLKFSEKPLVSDEVLLNTLKMVKLDKSLDVNAEHLSGGEKQRVALARVMVMDANVLLLDEPSSALDEETESLIIEAVVLYTKKNNKTLVMVTHSKSVANKYADEIIEIKKKISNVDEV